MSLILHVGRSCSFVGKRYAAYIRVWWWSSITFHRTKRMCFIFLQRTSPSSFVDCRWEPLEAVGRAPVCAPPGSRPSPNEESPFRIMILRFWPKWFMIGWFDIQKKKARRETATPPGAAISLFLFFYLFNVYLLSLTANHSGFYGHGFYADGWTDVWGINIITVNRIRSDIPSGPVHFVVWQALKKINKYPMMHSADNTWLIRWIGFDFACEWCDGNGLWQHKSHTSGRLSSPAGNRFTDTLAALYIWYFEKMTNGFMVMDRVCCSSWNLGISLSSLLSKNRPKWTRGGIGMLVFEGKSKTDSIRWIFSLISYEKKNGWMFTVSKKSHRIDFVVLANIAWLSEN